MSRIETPNFAEKCREIIKKCGLKLEDLAKIHELTGAKNAEELYYELENLLEKQIIKIK